MGIKYPTFYFRFVEREPGFLPVKILQQLWTESGWLGTEPMDDETWRPEGEWRDVPLERE